jgi:hypothetical protein
MFLTCFRGKKYSKYLIIDTDMTIFFGHYSEKSLKLLLSLLYVTISNTMLTSV